MGSPKKLEKKLDMRAALAKAKLPSVEDVEAISKELISFVLKLQYIVGQGLAFLRCDPPELGCIVPGFVLAELRESPLQAAYDGNESTHKSKSFYFKNKSGKIKMSTL